MEALERIMDLRARVLRGEELSIEELREAVDLIRAARAATGKPNQRKSVDVDEILSDLPDSGEEE